MQALSQALSLQPGDLHSYRAYTQDVEAKTSLQNGLVRLSSSSEFWQKAQF
jgi:hypothetical protein